MAGTYHSPSGDSRHGVVLGHCFTCSRHTRVLRDISHGLAENGFRVLRFDFSGNGQSEGRFSESNYSKQIEELKVAASFIAAQGVSWMGLAGHSMGAMVSLLAAAEMDQVQAVCTLATKASALGTSHFLNQNQVRELTRTGRVHFTSRGRPLEITQDFFADAARYELSEIIAALAQPLLAVHGNRDEIIPVEHAYELSRTRQMDTDLVIIPGADHMFSQNEHRRQAVEVIVKWFKNLAFGDAS